MVKLSIELKYLKPELGMYFNCEGDSMSQPSQLIMGEPIRESVYQCTGFWTLLTGQLYFLNQKVTLVQEEAGKAIYVENLVGITKGLHEIKFNRMVLKSHNQKGFMKAINAKFATLWSDKSEQGK